MGTIYPRSDHNPPYPEISNKDIYFDNFFGSFRNPIFGQIFGHQRAENEARNTKMKRGQETHPIKVNARYVMGGTNSFFFSKTSGNPIFDQIFGHQRAENKARNTKMYRGQETHPIKINSGYEINWAHSFFFNSRNPIFGPIFGHQRAENEARNTKMYRGQDTNPIRINARYEMNCANVFSKSSGNPIFGQMFSHQRAENDPRNTKMYWGQETNSIRVNARYEMNWANIFFQKVPETPFSAKYLATREPKMRPGTRK